ncbi:MAG: tetratricopeptide repeat protein [Deltaproteobacteria bacterium]|nr:tetratricopeptide repeat protein [Deltaproteobacteria bacterium]
MEENNKEMEKDQEVQEEKDPAQADYEQGKELRESGDEALAASCFHNALIGFEQSNNEKGVANASDQLGDICAARDEHEKALDHYQRAYDICAKEKDQFSLIALQRKMVVSKKALKKYDEAIKTYLKIIDIYAGYNNPAGTVTTMEDLAELYLEIGERQKSADTYRTIASIHKNFKHSSQAKEFSDKALQVEKGAL